MASDWSNVTVIRLLLVMKNIARVSLIQTVVSIFRGTFIQNTLNVSVLEVMKKTNIYLLPKLWFSLLFTLRS